LGAGEDKNICRHSWVIYCEERASQDTVQC
jgi:hypothetical protein